MKIEWTREMINFLTNTVEESDEISYTNIAKTMSERFHAEFTKNSLIGKARRLGLPMRTPAVTRKPRQRVHVAAPIPPKILPPKKGRPVTIYQLRSDTCRWPLDQASDHPPYMYCGAPTKDTCVWCVKHHQIAYRKSFTYDSAKNVPS
jgi:hypothetical protein